MSKKAREDKPKESNYTGFGLNPFPLLICVTIYVFGLGGALMHTARQSPALRGSTKVADTSFYLAEMKISPMKGKNYQDYIQVDAAGDP